MTLAFFGLLLLLIVIALAALKSKGKTATASGTFGQQKLATINEQKMFWRLVETFPLPEHMVFVQVSFGALLRAKEGASRMSFSQKRADFVLADKGFNVLAVIELDDKSHKDKEAQDAKRDDMLKEAGYKVLRFARIPEGAELLQALRPDPVLTATPD